MSTSGLSTQSAAERRAAEAALHTIIAKFAPDHLALITAMRRSLRKYLPTAHELVYEYSSWLVISFSPSEHGYEGVLAIRASTKGVDLYFNRGKGLPDPEKLLRGSAKLVRFVHVDDASTLRRAAIARLIGEAIGRNEVPFPDRGPGPIVIRSAAAKKSRPRRAT